MADGSSKADVRSPPHAAARSVQVFVRDPDSEGTLRQCFHSLGLQDAEFIPGDIKTAIATLAQRPSPRLLIVDVSGAEDPVSRVNELADVCEPNTGVIVLGEHNDIVLYRDLKRAGVAEYLFKPLVSDVVTRACSAVLSGGAEVPSARTGKLVFILGVRGGVGATTIATNVAWYLAETRQRWVMLVDLDLQYGDAALQFDSSPSHALREAFEHPERVDKLFLERALIHVRPRVDLLASLEPLGENVAIDESAILPFIENLLPKYRYIFVDLPATVATRLIQALHLPSTCVLVSNGSLVSAREVSRWREFIGRNTPDRTMLHVLNQQGAPGCLPAEEFARAAGKAPDIVVPYDREIAAASLLGVKGTQSNAALRRGLTPLLRHLTGEQTDIQRSVLSRIFG